MFEVTRQRSSVSHPKRDGSYATYAEAERAVRASQDEDATRWRAENGIVYRINGQVIPA